MLDSRFVLLGNEDNVFVCCERVLAGTEVCLEGISVALNTNIDVGHKIARYNLKSGEKIIKYGAPIGSTVSNINFAEHIHMHNMKSDYIASHTRQNKSGEA
ncbi:UxaA family hydrolase [Thalassotalea crassostreae]|uniref:UxaA family hydrolase n=1 Tax=Thalassotalea crassostreae TaxID=1763536 RepID=UPI0008387FEA|nr:UxaA family hydrolase [Thalassotalea crassostreae]